MKFFYSLFLFFIAINISYSQQYSSMLVEGVSYLQWTTACDVSGGENLLIGGDTVINDIQYKKLLRRQCSIEGLVVQGALRTDAQNGKLWYRESNSEEVLLMDLELEIGDVFYSAVFLSDLVVEAVDYVDDIKYITLSRPIGGCLVGPDEEKIQFIEGIGPTSGFRILDDMLLYCVSLGDSVVYKNEELHWLNCEVECLEVVTSVSNNIPKETEKFGVYSFSKTVIITSEASGVADCVISDIGGSRIEVVELLQGRNEIHLNEYNEGVYVVSIFCQDDRAVRSYKVVMN